MRCLEILLDEPSSASQLADLVRQLGGQWDIGYGVSHGVVHDASGNSSFVTLEPYSNYTDDVVASNENRLSLGYESRAISVCATKGDIAKRIAQEVARKIVHTYPGTIYWEELDE